MKKMILSLAAISSLGFAGGDIIAPVAVIDEIDDTGLYLGAGITAMSTRESSVSMDIFNEKTGQDRLGNFDFLGGYIINDYLAVEGRYGFGLSDEDKVEMKSQWGLYVKPMYKFEDDEDRAFGGNYFAVYALLGYGGIELQGINEVVANVDATGFKWGLGLSYTFREPSREADYKYKDSWTIYADYTDMGKDMDGLYYTGLGQVDADAFTVGLIYKF